MSRYIDSDKLIDEIERQNVDKKVIEPLIRIIDSLQQEQPQVADASKMERLNVDTLREWSMRYAPGFREMIEATAYHFWNLAISARKEQPKVDWEKEIDNFLNETGAPYVWCNDDEQKEWCNIIARHFFELGLNARKED